MGSQGGTRPCPLLRAALTMVDGGCPAARMGRSRIRVQVDSQITDGTSRVKASNYLGAPGILLRMPGVGMPDGREAFGRCGAEDARAAARRWHDSERNG